MARRVNTKFVVGLGTVLAVGTAGTFLLMRTNILETRDPVKLTAMGDAAEKKQDLASAARYYSRAADLASRAHAPDAAKMWERAAATALEMSVKEHDGLESQKDYQTARGWWNNALTQNPKYLPVLERVLEDSHAMAEFYRGAGFWTALQDAANKVIAADANNVNAYTYRGQARLELLAALTVPAQQEKQLDDAEADAKKALELDPDSDAATALAGRLSLSRMVLARAAGDKNEEAAKRDATLKLLKDFLAKHEGAPETSMTLAQTFVITGDRAGAVTTIEQAIAKNPGNVQVAALASGLATTSDPAKAEAVLKGLVEAATDKPSAYMRLATFYEQQGDTQNAITAWQGLLANPLPGGGLAAVKNQDMGGLAISAISWDYMDLAERAGLSTDAGKKAMASAVDYSEKLRSSRQSSGAQDLLDGRVQMMKLNLAQAIGLLRRAEASFRTPDQNYWYKTKMLLTNAYEMQADWGTALRSINDVVNAFPNSVGAHVRKAQILVKSGRYNEALAEAEPLSKAQIPESLMKAVQAVEATAYARLGNPGKSGDLLDQMGTPEALTQIARNRLEQGDAQGAMEQVDAVLAKSPDNLDALYLGVLAATQAGNKTQAADYVARGLKKSPDNTQFQLLNAALQDSGADLLAAQQKVLEAISDEVLRNMALAQLWGRQGDMTKQYAAMQAAAKAVDKEGEAAPRGAMNEVVDQLFVLSMQLARAAEAKSDKAAADQYWAQADKYVQQAETLNLDGVKGQMYRGRLQLAHGGTMAAAAVQTLEQAVSARQDTSMGHVFLGEAYASQKPPRTDAALDQFRTAIEQKPDNLAALRSAIALLVEKGDHAAIDEATVYYKRGLAFYPRDKSLADMGDVLGEPAEAIRTREAIRAKAPDNIENLKRLAMLYSRQGAPQKAIDVLRPNYDKQPDVTTADFLAKMYKETQQPGEAIKMYDPYVNSDDVGKKFIGLIDKGEMLRSLGQQDQAIQTFESALAIEPKGTDEAERRLADFYFDSGELAKAEGLYQKIHDGSRGADLKVTYRLAETLLREGKFAASNALLDKDVLAQRPQDAKALVLKAVTLLSQDKGLAAVDVLKGILSRDPNNTDALFYNASALLSLNQNLDEASRDLLAVRDAPGAPAETMLNSRLLLARVFRQSRRYTEAAGAYEEAINKFPQVPSIRVDYANYLLWVLGMDVKMAAGDKGPTASAVRSVKAQQRLDGLLANSQQAYPKAAVWQVLEGREAATLGDTAKAREKLAAAFESSGGKDPSTASAYLASLLAAKSFDDVVQTASKLLVDNSQIAEFYVQRGQAYAGLGKATAARDDFDRALALLAKDPDSLLAAVGKMSQAMGASVAIDVLKSHLATNPSEDAAQMALAGQLIAAGRGSEAIPVLSKLIADSRTTPGVLAQAKRALGLAKYQGKDFPGAYAAYMDVLKSSPNDAETLNNLAYMLSEDMNRPDDALTYAGRAVDALREGGPEGLVLSQGSVLDTYGWVKFRAGDKEGAISELRRATEIEALPMAYLHLAKVYKDIGRLAEARKTADTGIGIATSTNDPSLADLQGLRKELGS